ncbi:MAG: hypothetical protein ABIH23_14400 [bacterium]
MRKNFHSHCVGVPAKASGFGMATAFATAAAPRGPKNYYAGKSTVPGGLY